MYVDITIRKCQNVRIPDHCGWEVGKTEEEGIMAEVGKTVCEGCDMGLAGGGIVVRFNAEGGLDVYGGVIPITVHEVGERMKDGTIFAGISPDTGKPFYAEDADGGEYLTMRWKTALGHAADSSAHGLRGWRLPTRAELGVMFENRGKGALKGTFNETGFTDAGWYWSSTSPFDFQAVATCFKDGEPYQCNVLKKPKASVRLVRD